MLVNWGNNFDTTNTLQQNSLNLCIHSFHFKKLTFISKHVGSISEFLYLNNLDKLYNK